MNRKAVSKILKFNDGSFAREAKKEGIALCGELGIQKGEFFEVALRGVQTVSQNLEIQVATDSLSTEHYTALAVAPVGAWARRSINWFSVLWAVTHFRVRTLK